MHITDALISAPVSIAAGAVAAALVATAIRRSKGREELLALTGTLGAFVFTAQMVNFAIPATGSSGHLIGGILLAALVGPWRAFLTLAAVITLQCLLFADGGLLALGVNVVNMAALSCLVAYPLVFRPLRRINLTLASVAASIAALLAGALAVTVETTASGITALPFGRFLLFMLPIHLLIGVGEGLATAAVLGVVARWRPELTFSGEGPHNRPWITVFTAAALVLGASFSWVASTRPDGLEWSVRRTATATTGSAEPAPIDDAPHRRAADLQQRTALLPDYNHALAGILGGGLLIAIAVGVKRLRRSEKSKS